MTRETQPCPDDEDTQPEHPKDIGELPTLRWIRIAEKVEPAPTTLRWGSAGPVESNGSSE